MVAANRRFGALLRAVVAAITLLSATLAVSVGAAQAGTPPSAIGAPATAPGWTAALEAQPAQRRARALALSQAVGGAPQVLVVNNGGDYGNAEPAGNAEHMLQHIGYAVTLTSRLPRDLASYHAIWMIGTNAISGGDQATLTGFVRAGGGLYLTGERPCCEALNESDEVILRHLVANPLIRIGDGRDVENSSIFHDKFNPDAIGGLTQVPNSLSSWQVSAPGVITGMGYRNEVTFAEQLPLVVPTGAAWSSSELPGGRGNIVVMMDINWLESGYGDLPEAERFAANIERFLAGAPTQTGRYVALGDSFSSGVGNPPYEPENNPGKPCRRSEKYAYPDILAKELGLSAGNYAFNFVACSGATSKDETNEQLSELGPATKLVTVSAGGDDVYFPEVLKKCAVYSVGNNTSCGNSSTPELHDAVKNIQALRKTLESFYDAIKSKASAARVFVLGYPYIFPPNSASYCNFLNPPSVSWLYQRQIELDKVIRQATSAKGVTYVDPNVRGAAYSFLEDNQHKSHDICGKNSWFVGANPFTAGPFSEPTAFHPNQEGQRRLAEAFVAAGATKVKVNAALGQPLDVPVATLNSKASGVSNAKHEGASSDKIQARTSARALAAKPAASGTGSINGKVIGPGGEALAGVTVYLVSPELGYYGSAQTDAKGKYGFSGLPVGSYKVEFSLSGYETQWYIGKSSEAAATAIVLKAGASKAANATLAVDGTISGTVTASGGTGLAYARVVVTNGEGGQVGYAETNLAGEYTVQGLPAGSYKVQFQGGQYSGAFYEAQWYNNRPTEQSASSVTLASSQSLKGINAALAVDGTISGVVKAANGSPLSGIQVIARSQSAEQYAYTAENGEYTISGTPAGTYTVEFSAAGQPYATQWYQSKPRESEATPLAVAQSQSVTGVNAALAPDATIRGKVAAKAGRTLEGVQVVASEIHGHTSLSAYTAADGSYTIEGIPPGEYMVAFEPSGKHFAEQWFDGAANQAEARVLTLAPAEQRANVNAALEPTAATVEGIVRDSNGPVQGVNVLVLESSGQTAASATTDSEGTYVIEGLQAGTYTIEFEAEETEDISEYYDDVVNAPEAQQVTLAATQTFVASATLARGATISGTISASSGGLEGVLVDVFSESGEFVASTASGEAGAYTITGLTPGKYKLKLEPQEGNYVSQYYSGKNTLEAATLITVSAGETKTANAKLSAGGSIEGTVSAASGGARLENVRVLASDSDGALAASTTTGEDGTYTLNGLAAGSYTVQFEPQDDPYLSQYYQNASSLEGATQVSVTPGASKSGVNASLSPSASLSGAVTGPSGEAIGGVEVSVLSSDGLLRTTTSAANGGYGFTGLPAGQYTVHFEPPENNVIGEYYNGLPNAEGATPVVLEGGQSKEGVSVSLASSAAISGHVIQATGGNPIAGVQVTATGDDAAATASATTGTNGEYSITGLPAGSYTIGFQESDGYVAQYYNGSSTAEGAAPVTATAGSTTEAIDAELSTGASIGGTVHGEGGAPLAGVQVSANSGQGGASATATTGEDGIYSITGLPAGTYTVQFQASAANYVGQYYSGATSFAAATPVTLAAAQAKQELDATLTAGASISGTVQQAPGSEPLGGIDVYAYANCSTGAVATTDSEGRYTVEGLAAGTYHVVFNPEGGGLNVASYAGTVTLAKGAGHSGVNGSLTEQPEGEPASPFTCEESQQSMPPDFGRCAKASKGEFKTKACNAEKLGTGTGTYEWTPGVARPKIVAAAKTAKFENATKAKVQCKSASGAGEYSGTKALAGLVLKFSGCGGFGASCSSSGAAAGEIVTSSLTGALGWLERANKKLAIDLGAAGGIANFTCGTTAVSWRGGLIGPALTDKMAASTSLKFKASKGKQNPEAVEGGPREVLEQAINGGSYAAVGATFTLTLTSEEPVEASSAR
jgi:hypothetical protein